MFGINSGANNLTETVIEDVVGVLLVVGMIPQSFLQVAWPKPARHALLDFVIRMLS
jgi:hypothetical protein